MSLPFSLQDRHLTWNKMRAHLLTWIPPHTAVLPSNPPSHPSSLPKYTYPTVQVFLPPSASAIPASHLQPAPLCQTTSETTSQAKTPPRPPFHPRTGPSVAERRRRPPRQQRIDERITMAIRLKGEAEAEGPGHCTSETRMVSDTTSAKHGTCPCPPFISSP